jgi:hypothetical protein
MQEAAVTLDGYRKQKSRAPDNFMGRDLAVLVGERYPKLFGHPIEPSNINELNRGIYAGLSRDSHARLRLEPKAFHVLADGTVEVETQPLDERGKLRTLVGCLDQSALEALAALRYLDERRKAQRQKPSVSAQEGARPRGYRPDLGLHLIQAVRVGTRFHFTAVPVGRLGVYPSGMLSWSANVLLDDGEYIATFDVSPVLHSQMTTALGVTPQDVASRQDFWVFGAPTGARVNVQCSLGEAQAGATERFAPFVIESVSAARDSAPIGAAS